MKPADIALVVLLSVFAVLMMLKGAGVNIALGICAVIFAVGYGVLCELDDVDDDGDD